MVKQSEGSAVSQLARDFLTLERHARWLMGKASRSFTKMGLCKTRLDVVSELYVALKVSSSRKDGAIRRTSNFVAVQFVEYR